jgi:hypothetical protein
MKLGLFFCFLIIQVILMNDIIYGQNYCFSKISTIDLKGGYEGFASWCDYNSDGKLDIFVTGYDSGDDFQHAMLYKNNGDNTFSESNINNIPRVIYGSLSWGDYNNDGSIDLLYSGTLSGMSKDNITKVYKNNGNGNFTEINTSVIQVGEGDVQWVDINNDGKLDIFLMGINSLDQFDLGVYKNIGNDSFERKGVSFSKITGSRGNASKCISKWADFDNDGLKDVFIAMGSASDYSFKFYKNLGDFNFQEVSIGLPKLNYVSMAIGDINQDGLIDLAYIGSPTQTLTSTIYDSIKILINKSNLNFEKTQSISSVGVFLNTIDMADYNNDGYPDILYHGGGSDYAAIVFKNNKDNTFLRTTQYILDCEHGVSLFGDVDNNNVLDILHSGRMKYPKDFESTYVYENKIEKSNLKPTSPTELNLNAVKNDLIFNWNAGKDDSTKTESLYYNIRIGTKTNPDSIIAGNSTESNLKYYHYGNMNHNKSFKFNEFPEGSYVISVQSIDNSFNVSTYSDSLNFCFKHSTGKFSDTISICQGDSIKLDAGEGYLSYRWSTGDKNQAIFVNKAGLYNVNLLDNESCLSSETVFLKVNNLPEVNLPEQFNIAVSDSIVLDAGLNMNSYLWSNGDTTQSTVIFGESGNDGKQIIWVKVTDDNGCINIDTVLINLSVEVLSVNEFGFKIYPNPSKNQIKLDYLAINYKKNLKLQVIDDKGIVVLEKIYNNIPNEDILDISEFKSGLYFIKIKTDSEYKIEKIIKLD